ncbi:MAG: CDF family Co(II)/Ni(II) efflux transporter DmeF [Rhodospirillales bacterium]|nr:CDF family Co(II)/Ni(II) efflux transporter DmeF [Rhodospirillales bacterium]
MHVHSLDNWRHDHVFIDADQRRSERRAHIVIALTLVTMTAEIAGGLAFNSMALLADGWHMGSHAAALGITAFAYWYARKNLRDRRFTFGTGKVGSLGGFASAIVLGVVAVLVAWESAARFANPVLISFDAAMTVAVIGLIVNLVSAWLLHQGGHSHHGAVNHETAHHHHDHNLRAAFLHVLADALTSVLAILALLGGKMFGWVWLDPVIGLLGAALIAKWTVGLLRDTSRVLLDAEASPETRQSIRKAIEADADNLVSDLHVWKVGPNHLAAIVSLVTHQPRDPAVYKELLGHIPQLVHVTVEVQVCDGDTCLPDGAMAEGASVQ